MRNTVLTVNWWSSNNRFKADSLLSRLILSPLSHPQFEREVSGTWNFSNFPPHGHQTKTTRWGLNKYLYATGVTLVDVRVWVPKYYSQCSSTEWLSYVEYKMLPASSQEWAMVRTQEPPIFLPLGSGQGLGPGRKGLNSHCLQRKHLSYTIFYFNIDRLVRYRWDPS